MAIPPAPAPARRLRREGGREITTRRAGKMAEGGAGTTSRRAGMGRAGRGGREVVEGGGRDVRVGGTCLETIPLAARAEKTRHRHGGIRLAMMIPVTIMRAKRPSPPSATWRKVTIAWVRPCL